MSIINRWKKTRALIKTSFIAAILKNESQIENIDL